MIPKFYAVVVLLTGSWCALAAATAEAQDGPVCDCTYPADAYNYHTAAPMPGEAPREYFYRQMNRTRGPYGNPPIDYETFPEQQAAAAPPPEGAPDRLTSFNSAEPNELSQSYADGFDMYQQTPVGPTNQKPGVFQKWATRVTYMPQPAEGDLGQTDVETWVVFGLPCPTRDNPLLITPGFGARFLDGPATPDLPPTLYDVYVQFRWLGKVNDFWGYDIVFTPGVYGDLEEITDDTWRFTGRAVASYQWSPWLQLLFGVGYFDREDISALPVAGLIYEPCDGTRWELIFPRPRYAKRFYLDCEREDWWYIGGEFGGGSWTFQTPAATQDIVTLSDLRILIGLERKLSGGAGRVLEIGYVFSREIEIASMPGVTTELDSTVLVRGGITY